MLRQVPGAVNITKLANTMYYNLFRSSSYAPASRAAQFDRSLKRFGLSDCQTINVGSNGCQGGPRFHSNAVPVPCIKFMMYELFLHINVASPLNVANSLPPKSEDRRAENRGRGRGGVLGEGRQSPSPPARGSEGAL